VSRCLLGCAGSLFIPPPCGEEPAAGWGPFSARSPHPFRRAHRASRHPPLAGRDKRTPNRPAAQRSAKRSINALSLRYISAKRGMRGAKRPRPFFSGQPLGAPQRRAPSPRLPPLPRAAYELPAEMDLGFPTQAGGADEPLRWSVTPAAKREATLSQKRPQVRFAVLLRRRSPALSCQDGPRSRIPHGAGMGGV